MRTNYINPTEIVILDLTFDGTYKAPKGFNEQLDEPTGINTEKAINDSIDNVKSNLNCRRVKCNDQSAFLIELKNIKSMVKKNYGYPLIHIDGHGVDDYKSLAFPDYSAMSYTKVLTHLREINELCNNNLIVTSGACGFAYVLANGTTINAVCPVFYMLAPEQDVNEETMEKGFIAFFKEFVESNLNLAEANKGHLKHVIASEYSSQFAQDVIENSIISVLQNNEKSLMNSLVDQTDIGIINLKLKSLEKIFNRFLMVDKNQSRFQFDENKCFSKLL